MQDAETTRLSYAFEQWLFHYMGRDGISYLAVADADAGRRIPFAFLAQLETSFQQTGGVDGIGSPMSSNLSSFSTTMDELRHQFNETPDADPIQRAQA